MLTRRARNFFKTVRLQTIGQNGILRALFNLVLPHFCAVLRLFLSSGDWFSGFFGVLFPRLKTVKEAVFRIQGRILEPSDRASGVDLNGTRVPVGGSGPGISR